MTYVKTQLPTLKTHVVNLKRDAKDLSRDLQRLEVRGKLGSKTLYYRWSSGGQYNKMTQLSLFTISSQAPLVNILLQFWLEIWHMGEKFLKLCKEAISYALRNCY